MPAWHTRRTREQADGRRGLAFAGDSVEADDAEAAIRRARDLCRNAADRLPTGAEPTDPVGRILRSFTLALAREPLCRRATSRATNAAPCNGRGPPVVVA